MFRGQLSPRLRRGEADGAALGEIPPGVEVVRGWWQDLLSGTRSREEVSARAAHWARDPRLVECPFARRGLWHLYRAGLFHAETGEPVRSRPELAAAYETWCADQVLAAQDPQAWRLVARDRTLAVLDASRSARRHQFRSVML